MSNFTLSELPEYAFSMKLYKVCLPVLMLLGLFGNAMTIIVFRKSRLKGSTTGLILSVLAVNDSGCLLIGPPRFIYVAVTGNDFTSYSAGLCKMVYFVNYTLTDFSVWLVAIVVLERLVSVLKPHQVKVIITRNRIVVAMVVTFVSLMMVNCHFLWTFSINADEAHMFSCQVQDVRYKHFVTYVFPWLDFTAFFLLPVSIVVCCNMIIATKVLHAEIQRKKLNATSSSSGYKLTSMTVMMVAVSIFLVIATLPSIIYWLIEPNVASDDLTGQSSLLLLLTMSVISVYTNSAINFWMYSVCGSRFRQQLKIFIRCKQSKVHPQTARPGVTLNSTIDNAPPNLDNKNENAENSKPGHVARANSMVYHR